MKYLRLSICLSIIACVPALTVQGESTTINDVSAFKSVMEVAPEGLIVPTVVEVPLWSAIPPRAEFLVFEDGITNPIASYVRETYLIEPLPFKSTTVLNGVPFTDGAHTDQKPSTSARFNLASSGYGTAEVTFTFGEPIRSSTLLLDLGRNVRHDGTITVSALENGLNSVILSEATLEGETVSFLPTSSSVWTIRLTYAQPLDINEMSLVQEDAEQSVERGLRFLAQPGASYTVLFDADRSVYFDVPRGGDLVSDQDVRIVPALSVTANPRYRPGDSDGDGIVDNLDNCVDVRNETQDDINGNSIGDACEDFDRDGYLTFKDNCPDIPNRDQRDTDGDGIGDACDGDESRLTERYGWIPWAGMGIAGLVIVILFMLVATTPKNKPTAT